MEDNSEDSLTERGDAHALSQPDTTSHQELFRLHEGLPSGPPGIGSKILTGLFLLWAFSGFVYSPGTGFVNDMVVRGRIMTEDGRPLADEPVELMLPAAYGLSAMEAKDPARFGNETRRATVITDSDGEFVASFGPRVYHIDIYLLSFAIPGHAPALRFAMRVPRISSEYYAIHAREGVYKAFSDEGLPMRAPAAPIASLSVREELKDESNATEIVAIVEVIYGSTARQNARNYFQPRRRPS